MLKRLHSFAVFIVLTGCVEPGGNDKGGSDLNQKNQSAVAAYSEHLWPLLKDKCGKCHGVNQTPLFATNKLEAAFQIFSNAKVVNLESPESSRLIQRLKDEKHNCWSECEADATTMIAAVNLYVTSAGGKAPSSAKMTEALKLDTLMNGMIEYDLSKLVGSGHVKLVVQIEKLDEQSFKVKNPSFVTDVRLKITDMKILVNGQFDPRNSTFVQVDQIIEPPGRLLDPNTVTMIVGMDKGLSEDLVSWSFEVLQVP